MTNIITFDGFQDSDIRVTPSGQYSVFDVIKFCGQKNPWEPWKRLCAQHSEVLAKCEDFKFSGKGQRNTPVAGREEILYIIGLLPGAVGRSYREATAKVFLQYLDASPELAESVIDRATPEDLKRIEQRLQGKKVRVAFTHVLQSHGVTEGWQFGAITNTIYRHILGGTAQEVKKARNLPEKANIRDHYSLLEGTGVNFVEELGKKRIENQNLQGFKQCNNATDEIARKVKALMDEY